MEVKEKKKRKPRDTSYSVTQKLLKQFGEQKLYDIWAMKGQYHASKVMRDEYDLIVSPAVFRHLSNKINWTRTETNEKLTFVKGVRMGTQPASFYKHVIFPGLAQTEQKCEQINNA